MRTALMLLLVVLCPWQFHAQGQQPVIVADTANLVGRWQFAPTGSLVIPDTSDHGNDGVLLGAAFTSPDPIFGGSLTIANPGGVLLVPWRPGMDTAIGTIQVWMKVQENHNWDIVAKGTDRWVRSGNPAMSGVLLLRIWWDGRVQGVVGNDYPSAPGPWTEAITKKEAKAGEWHMLALRWDKHAVAVFIDGHLAAATPYLPVPGLGLSYSGQSGLFLAQITDWGWDDGHHQFIGQLADFRYYSVARSEGEIHRDFMAVPLVAKKP